MIKRCFVYGTLITPLLLIACNASNNADPNAQATTPAITPLPSSTPTAVITATQAVTSTPVVSQIALPTSTPAPTPFNQGSWSVQPLNDTGVTQCGDYAFDGGSEHHNNSIDCVLLVDGDGDNIPAGQDALLGRDAESLTGNLLKQGTGAAGFDFTKLDGNGLELAENEVNHACVRDNTTGLVWEVKSPSQGSLRGASQFYSWYDPSPDTNMGKAGKQGNTPCTGRNCDTNGFIDAVNSLEVPLCGYTDWRLPTVQELVSIVDLNPNRPALDSRFFPNARNDTYWTNNSNGTSRYEAWTVSGITVRSIPKRGEFYEGFVRLVRGEAE